MLIKRFTTALLPILMMTGCSAVPRWVNPVTWFEDEEELEIRQLAPISAEFTPTELWEQEFDTGVDSYFSRLRPVVAYDKVFAATRQGRISAFDPATGAEIWQTNMAEFRDEGVFAGVSKLWSDGISAKVSGGLAAAYQTVFFGTENGLLIALDADTGALKWQAVVKGEVLAAPAVDEGLVIVNTAAGVLHALDAETGESAWQVESEVPPLTLRGIAAPAIAAGGAIIGTATGKLQVYILDSGQLAWDQVIASASGTTELERLVDIDSQPLIIAGVVYTISYNGTLAATELRSGRIIWKREYQSYRRLSLSGNMLFVVDEKSQVYALDRRNGVQIWTNSELRRRDLTAATPVRDYIVVGDKYGYLHWLQQDDGKLVARVEVGNDEDEGIYAAPVVAQQIIYTQTRDGELVAISTP